jgi:pimeloyl-ACP methyl ester carboxylesterase
MVTSDPIELGTIQQLGLAVYRQGQGAEPVWFIHGLGMHHGFWSGAKQFFDLERFSLYFVDLPGFGKSDKSTEFTYEMPALASRVSQAIEHFKHVNVHLVAHSMGGIIALLLTESAAFNILSLTLAEGNLVGTDAIMSRKIAARTEAKFTENYDHWVSILGDFMTDERQALKDRYTESLRRASAIAMYRASKSCAEWSQSKGLDETFNRLTCPRAYVVGEKSRHRKPLPKVVFDPNVTLLTVNGQGHFMMDDTDGFYAPIAKWIGSLPRH